MSISKVRIRKSLRTLLLSEYRIKAINKLSENQSFSVWPIIIKVTNGK